MSKSKTPGSGKEPLYTGSYRQTSEASEHQDLTCRQDISGPTGDTSIGALNHEGLINNHVKNAHSDSGRDTHSQGAGAESDLATQRKNADGVTVLTSHPDMPRTLLANARKGYFLCTYVNEWVPAHINEKGEHVPGRSKPAKRVTIGRIHSPDGLGLVEFNEKFYEDYPSLRDYIVTRVGKAQFEFRPVGQLSAGEVDSLRDGAVASASAGTDVGCNAGGSVGRSAGSRDRSKGTGRAGQRVSGSTVSDTGSGAGISPSAEDDMAVSSESASLLYLLQLHENAQCARICAPVVDRSPDEITGRYLKFGSVLLMLHAMHESGITYCVTEGLKKAHALKDRQLKKVTCRVLARAVYMALTRDLSCQGLEEFYRNNYFPGLGGYSTLTMKRAENLINKDFISHAQQAFHDYHRNRARLNSQDGTFSVVVEENSLATDNSEAGRIDVQISHLTKGAVYSCKQLAMGVLESGANSAENNEEMNTMLEHIWMATVARIVLSNTMYRARQKGVECIKDFSSLDNVLTAADGLKVDTLVCGIEIKPASQETLSIMETFGLNDIPCRVTGRNDDGGNDAYPAFASSLMSLW